MPQFGISFSNVQSWWPSFFKTAILSNGHDSHNQIYVYAQTLQQWIKLLDALYSL